jgi:hypothetical protein
MARESDPAAGPSPDPLSPAPLRAGRSTAHRTARPDRATSTRRPAPAPTPVPAPGRPTRARHGRTARRRRRRPVRHLLFLPFRRVLVSYVRELLRALLPWLLPLALLAALPRILSLLGGH